MIETFQSKILRPGPSISLKCIGSGTPIPEIFWKVDDVELSNDNRYRLNQFVDATGNVISTLNISSTKAEDGGLYKCVAKNRLGEEEHSALLSIYGE